MSPRNRNPFRSPPGARYSKTRVNGAGEFLREFYFTDWALTVPEDERADYIQQVVEDMRILHWWRDQHASPLAATSRGLRYHVGKVVSDQPQVAQRLKRVPTMINKLERIPGMKLARMADVGGVRARLPSIADVYKVVDRLERSRWKIKGTPHDYIANPKNDGYRAFHLFRETSGMMVEVQLRTERQDIWANRVEKDGRLGNRGYKFGRGAEEVRNYYRTVSEVFAVMDADHQVSSDLTRRLNESYMLMKQATLDEWENDAP